MNKKFLLLIFIIIGAVFYYSYQSFFKEKEPAFTLVEVKIGNVTQEVSETGIVRKGDEINLSFRNTGRIERIYVKVGEKVRSGQSLAKIETTQLSIQLTRARAALELVQAQLDKLLAGASFEAIKQAETSVENAKVSLESVRQNLEDVRALSEESLTSAYEDSLNSLEDAYLDLDNAFNTADLVQRAYFTENDQEGIISRRDKDDIKDSLGHVKAHLDIIKGNSGHEDIDLALTDTEDSLNASIKALESIRAQCETLNYRKTVSSTDKTSLDTQRTYINAALSAIVNSRQNLSSIKITNQANINAALAKVFSAEGSVRSAEDQLALVKAGARSEDIALYQAQIKQSKAEISLLENQFKEASLISPIPGQIIKVNKEAGEIAQATMQDAVFTLLPETPFQIEVDIYEEDVVKVDIENPADVSLVAFPDQIFKGKIISIDPSEKLIEGVVYYKVIIAFEEIPEGVKPGMTADLVIKTAQKENVLIVIEDAVQEKDDKDFVEVLKDGEIEEREIETGILGSDDMIEVILGLEDGEKVILR